MLDLRIPFGQVENFEVIAALFNPFPTMVRHVWWHAYWAHVHGIGRTPNLVEKLTYGPHSSRMENRKGARNQDINGVLKVACVFRSKFVLQLNLENTISVCFNASPLNIRHQLGRLG